MLDPRLLRDDTAALREAMRRRDKLETYGPLIDEAEGLERARRQAIQRAEERKAERNRITQEVGKRKKAGEDAAELQASARSVRKTGSRPCSPGSRERATLPQRPAVR